VAASATLESGSAAHYLTRRQKMKLIETRTLPERRFPEHTVIPDDQLSTKLLAIALDQLPKAKPLA
jgi:hypothetical protein